MFVNHKLALLLLHKLALLPLHKATSLHICNHPRELKNLMIITVINSKAWLHTHWLANPLFKLLDLFCKLANFLPALFNLFCKLANLLQAQLIDFTISLFFKHYIALLSTSLPASLPISFLLGLYNGSRTTSVYLTFVTCLALFVAK